MENTIEKDQLLARRYKILGTLGEGGMGSVYRVEDTLTHQVLALKQIRKKPAGVPATGAAPSNGSTAPEVSNGQAPKPDLNLSTLGQTPNALEPSMRFKLEFRSMAKLVHPNIVKVMDFGVLENGDEYFTMELVPGEELQTILQTRPLEYKEIYVILSQLCQVLNFVHTRNMVHRDLKPANIRIMPSGDMKLMDFGLMQQMGLPSNGEITGTVYYLPPESVAGGVIDARSDLYSLGALGFQLVTGRPPFVGRSLTEIIKKHLEQAPPPLKELRPDVPEELARLITKLLAKDQKDRYQSVPELWEDLGVLSGQTMTLESAEQKKSYLNCSQLIGREKDFEALKQGLRDIQSGKGRSIFMGASAGVGKSRLIQEFRLKAQLAEITFVAGQCTERSLNAYGPFGQAFATLMHWTDKEVLDKEGRVLVKILPALKNKGYEPEPALDPVGEKLRLFESVTSWLKAVAVKTPFVLCLEDLHWADPATLELLNHLIRECKGSRILFLGNFRDDEVDSKLLYQTEEEGHTQVLKLEPLDEDHTGKMIAEMLGKRELPGEFSKGMYKATAGNPYFLSEAMRSLIEEESLKLVRGKWHLPVDLDKLVLPTSIEGTILRRLERLSEGARKLAGLASVGGREMELSFLKDQCGLDEQKLFELLEELQEKQFIQKQNQGGYRFTHDRVVETLYKKLDGKNRQDLHGALGGFLEKKHPNKEKYLGILAFHFSRSDNKHKAADYLLQAGLQAYNQCATVEASKRLKEGIDILETLENFPDKKWWLLEAREKLYVSAVYHDGKLCVETCEQHLKDLFELAGGEGRILFVVKLLRMIFGLIDRLPKATATKIKIALNTPPQPNPIGKGKMDQLAARLDYGSILARIITCQSYCIIAAPWAGQLDKIEGLLEKNYRYLPDTQGVFRAVVLYSSLTLHMYQGRLEKLKRTTDEAVAIFHANEELLNRDLWNAYCATLYQRMSYDCWRASKSLSQEARRKASEIAEKMGFLDMKFFEAGFQCVWHAYHGRQKEFNERIEESKILSRKMGKPVFMETCRLNILTFQTIQRGDLVGAQQTLAKWSEIVDAQNDWWDHAYVAVYRGLIAQEQGSLEEALKYFESAEGFSRNLRLETLPESLYRRADIFVLQGREEEARRLFEEAKTILEDPGVNNSYRKIHVYRSLGLLALKNKNSQEAKEWLNKAMTLCEESANEFETAWTLAAYAQMHVQEGQTAVAQKELSQAREKLVALGQPYQAKKLEKLSQNLMSPPSAGMAA